MSKIQLAVLYGQPTDADQFEAHYSDVHLPLVSAMPGLEAVESGRVVRAMDRGEIPFHRVALLTFADKAAMGAAFGSPEGKLVGEDFATAAPEGTRQFLIELD
jgi:uncharacterized protein (TIGR02118 family)